MTEWINLRTDATPTVTLKQAAIPSLELKGYVTVPLDEVAQEGCYQVLSVKTRVALQGIPLFFLVDSTQSWTDIMKVKASQLEYGCSVYLDRMTLQAIEKTRANDVNGSVTVSVILIHVGSGTIVRGQTSLPLKFSQTEWTRLLSQLGWKTSWIIEMERPAIEGWGDVQDHLSKAEERLVAHDADGVMMHCRAAWAAADPLLDVMWSTVTQVIDRGSKDEPSEPAKSQRILNLKKAALKFTHTGPHSEFYTSSMDDAILVYRLAVSILSYLSRAVAEGARQ